MNAPADSAAEPEAGASESAAGILARAFGVSPEAAKRLAAAGYTSVERVREISADGLRAAGLDPADVERILHPPSAPPTEPADPWATNSDRMSEQLMASVRPKDSGRRRRPSAPGKDSVDVVRKWVGGDDRALETWMRSSPSAEPMPPKPKAEAPAVAPAPAVSVGPAPPESAAPPVDLVERERTVLHWLTELLDRMKSDQFDPATVLQDVQDLQRELYDQRAARARLESEIEQVKRGSIAVIKYIRSREAKLREQGIQEKEAELADLKLRLLEAPIPGDGPAPAAPALDRTQAEARLREEFGERESAYAEREAEMRRQVVQLGAELRELRVAAHLAEERVGLAGQSSEAVAQVVDRRLIEVEAREKQLVTRENELRSKFEEIRIRAQEAEQKVESSASKQKDLEAYQHQLETNKATLEVEARRLEQLRQEEGEAHRSVQLRQLEELRTEVARREEELRAREERLRAKSADVERRVAQAEGDGATGIPDQMSEDSKLPTGVRRLDDLLYGGLPHGSQILINGPAHTGKETLSRLFVAEGLRRGVPAIWVLTDKTYLQVREEMTALLPSYPQLEASGMVRYVDLYSRSLGVSQAEPGVRLFQVTDKGVLDQLTLAVNTYANELKASYPTYRLVFESVSTVTAYLDLSATFRFFQPFTGRRKLDGAVAYYLLETGMHSDSDMESLEHMVDGALNLKIEQLKTFLSVRGITDSQSRAWVGYTFTRKTFGLGSFSLEHIR